MEFWRLELAVEADAEVGRLTPRIRLNGGTPFSRGRLKVTLVDRDGRRRGSQRRAFFPEDRGRDLRLEPIAVPEGIAMRDALAWAWDVTVATNGRTRIQWRRYLEASTEVAPDGELRLAGPSEALRSKAEEEGWGPEAPWDARDTERLLASFVADGTLAEADRRAVLAEAEMNGKTAERLLVDRGLVTERRMLERYAEVTGTEFVRLDEIDRDAAFRIPEEMARDYGLVPVRYRAGLLMIAMSDPQNLPAVHAVQSIAQPYIVVATRDDVERALDRLRPR